MSENKRYKKWKVIALSFIGAVVFWFFSALDKNYTKRIKYPVYFEYDRDSLVSVQELPAYFELDVGGGGWDLFRQNFWYSSEPVIISLQNPAATNFLTKDQLLPHLTEQLSQFQINFLLVDTVKFAIDRKVSKQVALKVDSQSISLDKNFRITTPIKVQPEKVTIFGPERYISSLGDVYIFQIPNLDIDRDFDRYIEFGIPDEYGIFSEPSVVNVIFDVDEFENVSFQIQVDKLNFPEDFGYLLNDSVATISYTVGAKVKDEVALDDFEVVLDYNLLNPADSLIPLIMVFYPEEIESVEMSPDSIRFIYEP